MVYLVWRAHPRTHATWWHFLLPPGQVPSGSWSASECLDRWVLDRPVESPAAFTALADLRQWVLDVAEAGARPEPVETEAGA